MSINGTTTQTMTLSTNTESAYRRSGRARTSPKRFDGSFDEPRPNKTSTTTTNSLLEDTLKIASTRARDESAQPQPQHRRVTILKLKRKQSPTNEPAANKRHKASPAQYQPANDSVANARGLSLLIAATDLIEAESARPTPDLLQLRGDALTLAIVQRQEADEEPDHEQLAYRKFIDARETARLLQVRMGLVKHNDIPKRTEEEQVAELKEVFRASEEVDEALDKCERGEASFLRLRVEDCERLGGRELDVRSDAVIGCEKVSWEEIGCDREWKERQVGSKSVLSESSMEVRCTRSTAGAYVRYS